jgi:phospholipid-binding lipoprotein MlaA
MPPYYLAWTNGVSAMRGMLTALGVAACFAVPSLVFAQEAPGGVPPAGLPFGSAPTTETHDPWEGLNRDLFAIHEGVDQAVLEPVARGYRAITPRPVRSGVRNFLRNLRAPVIFANDVLQGEFRRAGTTAARFGVNTTIGIAGVFDPAERMGLERHDEDFGQTLAVWGVDSGPYIFVPLMGPTTVRDGAGRIIDIAFDPFTWAEFDEADEVRAGRTVLAALSARESVLDTVDDIRRDSLDPYVTIRSSYSLLRESAIQNGETNVEDLPEFESFDEPTATELPDNSGVIGDNTQHLELNQSDLAFVDLAQSESVPMSASAKPEGDLK